MRRGDGLKYPAVKVHDDVVRKGEEERVVKREIRAGSSVDLSRDREEGKRGVNWERG